MKKCPRCGREYLDREEDCFHCKTPLAEGASFEGHEEKALKSGASKLFIEDLREEFVAILFFLH